MAGARALTLVAMSKPTRAIVLLGLVQGLVTVATSLLLDVAFGYAIEVQKVAFEFAAVSSVGVVMLHWGMIVTARGHDLTAVSRDDGSVDLLTEASSTLPASRLADVKPRQLRNLLADIKAATQNWLTHAKTAGVPAKTANALAKTFRTDLFP